MDLSNLTPDQLRALKSQLDGVTDTSGRSPFRPRQLHDLRLAPTATDPRPMFVWSAEPPRDLDVSRGSEFPKLMWHRTTGEEITVYNMQQQIEQGSIYSTELPAQRVIDPLETMREALDGLSDEDRALVLEAQKRERISALQSKLANLSEDQLEALLASSGEPAKRKPGRPRKVDAA